ncbi:MAG: stage II sporulation protein R [Sulfobacillus benefaciens]|jgi:stage II sporulation protein R|uniref:Stage II sporulation protein R n=1 Tax=Sulfobacillus benefaciens TaxID=453960 RepID=A0A2T2X6Z7_9FIRM|nr:MAG: stage II sporulation protein R [Sulfobacillus benefaciens]HBQ94480.1 stage II sporulation protein R [Sulfobacillus sp.]
MTGFKQIFVSALMIIHVLGFALGPYQGSVAGQSHRRRMPIHLPAVIRFRVIANSDNPADQAVKLDVRDRVLAKLDPLLAHVKTRREAERVIQTHERVITRAADQVLSVNHVSYRAHVSLTRTDFPTKVYGTWVLPAGKYQALLVVLGKGQGHNWWCVLFPSLCFIDMSNAVAVSATRAQGQATLARPAFHRENSEPVPAVPIKLPPSPQTRSSGQLHVRWSLPRFVNHLLGWM